MIEYLSAMSNMANILDNEQEFVGTAVFENHIEAATNYPQESCFETLCIKDHSSFLDFLVVFAKESQQLGNQLHELPPPAG